MHEAILTPQPHLSEVYYEGIEPVDNNKEWLYQCRYIFNLQIHNLECDISILIQEKVCDRKKLNDFLPQTIEYILSSLQSGSFIKVFGQNSIYVPVENLVVACTPTSNITLTLSKEVYERLYNEISRRNKIDAIFQKLQSYLSDLNQYDIQSLEAKKCFDFLIECSYKSTKWEYQVNFLKGIGSDLFRSKTTQVIFDRAKNKLGYYVQEPKFYTEEPRIPQEIENIYNSLITV